MLLVVRLLDLPAAVGLVDGLLHRRGDPVRVHVDLAGDVAGRAADGLDQRGAGAQKALLVRVQDRHQRHLGQVQALTEQVDAHQHVVLAGPQLAQQLDPAQRVDVAVQVPDPDVQAEHVVGEVLGHLLGERGDQDPLVLLHPLADLVHQVVDLALGRLDDHLGVDQAGRADDLLDRVVVAGELELPRGRRQVDGLADPLQELLPLQRAVVHRRGQPEAVLDQGPLARGVALVHGADLRHGDVRLVDDQEEVLREVVEQGVRRGAGLAAVEVHRVVLDPGAGADLAQHLQVVGGAHAQPLGLQQLALLLHPGEGLLQLLLDVGDRALHPLRTGHVVRGREDVHGVVLADDLAGERVQRVQRLDLVAEHLDPDGQLLVDREDLDGVAPDPEGAAAEGQVVAGVLDVDEAAQQHVPVDLLADLQPHHPVHVLLRGAEAVDAGHRRDHDHVPAGEQRVGRRVAQPLDLLVDRGVLLDVGVRLRDVRLGLVVVVVRDEVLDRVVGQQLAELVRQLRRQRLVRRHHQGGPLQLLDHPGRGGRLAGTGGTEQDDVLLPAADPPLQLGDRRRLVTVGLVGTDDLEGRH